jgi:homoserine/homoserine lactone efflux protein
LLPLKIDSDIDNSSAKCYLKFNKSTIDYGVTVAFDTWLLYLGTIIIFMSAPGPSHLLMISVGMSNAFPRSLATASGDLSANVIQIILAGVGLATLVVSSQYGFTIIKWLGVVYLVWMGVQKLRATFLEAQTIDEAPAVSLQSLWLKGFITSAANPKAVVFFAALFPLFITENIALLPQAYNI